MLRWWVVRVVGLLCLSTTSLSAAPAPKAIAYDSQVLPLLKKYCHDCHGGKEPDAGVPLDIYPTAAKAKAERRVWEKVRERVGGGLMPPPDSPQPTAAESQVILDWVEREFFYVDCNAPPNPGRVTMRRLNRAEYNNTIRDLVGVDFRPADDFPSDDVGYGFDNIGDVLSMPPILMEKYLAAADKVMDRALVVPERAKPTVERIAADKMKPTTGAPAGNGKFNLFSTGELGVERPFNAQGEYILRARAAGQQAGPEAPKLIIKFDGKELISFDVRNEEKEYKNFEYKLTVDRGQHTLAVAFPNDFYDEKAPPRRRDRNLVVEWFEIEGPLDISHLPLPETHTNIITRKPKNAAEELEVAKLQLAKFARRAFRRPALRGEVDRLAQIVQLARSQGDSYERGMQLACQAVLASPHFLFRVENDPVGAKPGQAYELNDYELASRLSYFLWSSMPDEELFQLAAKGELKKPAVIDAQVRRMLKDPRSEALVENFATQWLQIRNLKIASPDPKRYPKWDDDLRLAMEQETKQFFAGVMREDRSVLDFLNSDYTYLNERLASHYEIPGVKGKEFRKVSLKPDQHRGGVLTQGAVLVVTSNPTRTSPVKRGKYVLEQLLGAPPPPPPPAVPELNDKKDASNAKSLRERMEIHRKDAACAACHAKMDPLGFGFENFDAIGGWRTKDGKFEIDSAGVLPGGKNFKGPEELKTILLTQQAEFRRCLADKMLTYAMGRGVEYYDKCAVDQITSALSNDGNKFSRLVIEIVRSVPFRMRKAQGE